MRGASLVVYIDKNGKVMKAKNVNPKNGIILDTEIKYGEEEKKAKKKIENARLANMNLCCWKLVGGVWKCNIIYCS